MGLDVDLFGKINNQNESLIILMIINNFMIHFCVLNIFCFFKMRHRTIVLSISFKKLKNKKYY